MRSKWLDWTPDTSSVGFEGPSPDSFRITQTPEGNEKPIPTLSSDQIIEKTAQGEPTKPSKSGSQECGERLLEKSSNYWGSHCDAYGWRVNVALDAICEIPAPEGLVVWLDEYSPFLYRNLTSDLPNRISRAWNDQVPYLEFDALCFELVDTYRSAVEVYRTVEMNGKRDAKKSNS